MTRWRRLVVPGISTAVMLSILCGLGAWQVQRLHWKTALLARIDAAEAAPGIPLPPRPEPFEKVRVTGRFRPGAAARYGVDVRDVPQGRVLGSQVVVLLNRAAGPPIVVLRGWAPAGQPTPLPQGEQTLDGYIRLPARPGLFSPSDDPAARQFYTLAPAAIGRALGAAQVAPFTLVVMGQPQPGVYPAPAVAMPRPPNDHLQYALTWFGLGGVLIVYFGLYTRQVLSQ